MQREIDYSRLQFMALEVLEDQIAYVEKQMDRILKGVRNVNFPLLSVTQKEEYYQKLQCYWEELNQTLVARRVHFYNFLSRDGFCAFRVETYPTVDNAKSPNYFSLFF